MPSKHGNVAGHVMLKLINDRGQLWLATMTFIITNTDAPQTWPEIVSIIRTSARTIHDFNNKYLKVIYPL